MKALSKRRRQKSALGPFADVGRRRGEVRFASPKRPCTLPRGAAAQAAPAPVSFGQRRSAHTLVSVPYPFICTTFTYVQLSR